MYYDWGPYVSAAERRRKARTAIQKLKKKGQPVSPVTIEGRTIARSFWGKSWCDNLERYSDFGNRLPRGRSYLRNGSVLDLQISPGMVIARVSGSSLYTVTISVNPVVKPQWNAICTDCAGEIDSLVELLQGRFSRNVMERMCRQKTGLFPTPAEIKFTCTCPDWAHMCKHVAAVLYGIGARFDELPELLFTLRQVDGQDLLTKAGTCLSLTTKSPGSRKVLKSDQLSDIFGLDIDVSDTPAPAPKTKRGRPAQAKPTLRKTRNAKPSASDDHRMPGKTQLMARISRKTQKTEPERPEIPPVDKRKQGRPRKNG